MVDAQALAHHLGALGVLLVVLQAHLGHRVEMRRCTGFNPSRASGSARPMITDIE
jgi:hypothetical protein